MNHSNISRFHLASLMAALIACLITATHASPIESALRVDATTQSYNLVQPWQKNKPTQNAALGAFLGDGLVVTTADVVADATYVELSNAEMTLTVTAEVSVIDYEANLALLRLQRDDDSQIFAGLKPLDLAPPLANGSKLKVWQISDNGLPLVSGGSILGAELISPFIGGHTFLTYELKSSLQSSNNSQTVPVVDDQGRLAGLLNTYDSESQIAQVIASPIIAAFLADYRDGDYQGFPLLGIAVEDTVDPAFRQFLQLSDTTGGLFISKVSPNSPAEAAGLQQGDVILAVDGISIDRRGYYEDPIHQRLYWVHLIRARKKVGDQIELSILREGEEIKIKATLGRDKDPLIPPHNLDAKPTFLVHGGLIFQELTRPYFSLFGDEWATRAPLHLLETIADSDDFKARGLERIVILSAVIPTPATLGYEPIAHQIVAKVNGVDIINLASLDQALRENTQPIHTIEITESPYKIYLDIEAAEEIDNELLNRGLSSLKNLSR